MNNTKKFNTKVISSKDNKKIIEVQEVNERREPKFYHHVFGPTPKDFKDMNLMVFTLLISLTGIPSIIKSLNEASTKKTIMKILTDYFYFESQKAHILSLSFPDYISKTLFISILSIILIIMLLNSTKTTKTNTTKFSIPQIIMCSILSIMLSIFIITLFFSVFSILDFI